MSRRASLASISTGITVVELKLLYGPTACLIQSYPKNLNRLLRLKLNRRSSGYFDYPGVFALPLVGFRRVSCLSRVSSVYPALLREISLSKRLVDQARVSPPAFVNRLPCPAAFRSFEPNLYFLLDILLLATFTRS